MYFNLGAYDNYRGAFGLFPMPLTVAVSAVLILIIAVLFSRSRTVWEKAGYAMLLFGGAANFIERIFRGKTKDYFLISNIGAFNAADILIGGGIVLLAVFQIVTLFTTRVKK